MMHYYQFHIGDYKSHTHHLNIIEDIAYRRLLDFYYLHETPIKQRDIARQIGMREYEQEVLAVLNEFFLSTDDGFINIRADDLIKKYKEHQAKSAWGAFIRDNPVLEKYADKVIFISHYLMGTYQEYISTLKQHHGDTMGTSLPDDATNNQEPITTNHKPVTSINTAPEGVSQSVWQDFVSHRKANKASITQTAISRIASEASKAGWTLEQALSECVARGWRGFKAEWVAEKQTSSSLSKTGQMNQSVMSGLTRGLIGGTSNVKLLG